MIFSITRGWKKAVSHSSQPCHLRPSLKEEVEKSQVEAKERMITLSFHFLAPTSRSLRWTRRIRQVVWNLIYNALKFTSEEGRVVLRARADEDAITIEVSDTGIGISPKPKTGFSKSFFRSLPRVQRVARTRTGLGDLQRIVLAHEAGSGRNRRGWDKGLR